MLTLPPRVQVSSCPPTAARPTAAARKPEAANDVPDERKTHLRTMARDAEGRVDEVRFEMVKRKGDFPYEWFDHWSKFSHLSLPSPPLLPLPPLPPDENGFFSVPYGCRC